MKLTYSQKRKRVKVATAGLILLSWLVLYLLGSFTVWSLNPGDWDEVWRGTLFAVGIIATIGWLAAAFESLENLKHA